jgi:hypothetical protein
MSEIKTYNIDSLDKLCNAVTVENSTRLALDLGQWLIYYALTIQGVRDAHPKETKGKRNTKIAKASFTWVDDGKNDLLHSTIEDATTGEVTVIDHKKLND